MESMPFLYANQIFTITFTEDLAFSEVRSLLGQLLAMDAFNRDVQADHGRYQLEVDEQVFSVWVHEMEVIIQRGAAADAP